MVSGSMWAVAAELVAGGLRAISYVIFAKLLSPTDFGLIGFGLLIINFFPLVLDNSLGLALMRYPEQDDRVMSTVFVLNIVLAVVAVALLCLFSPWSAVLLHDRRVVLILPILSSQLILNALCSVQIAAARRRFHYRRLAPVRLISSLSSLLFGLPLAFLGYGYWALVAASVGSALGQMIAAQLLLGWWPKLQFDWSVAKSVSAFTSWVAVDMGVTWMVMSGGGFFLAFFLGAHDLSLFRLSDRVDTYFLGAVLNPLIPVLYASFCEVSAQPGASWRVFERSLRVLTPISLAAGGLVLVASLPMQGLLSAQWQGIGPVMALNAAADGISFVTLGVPSLLRAHGLAKVVAMMRLATVGAQVAVYFSVARLGLGAFLLGKIGLEMAIYAGSFLVLRAKFAQPIAGIIRNQLWQAIIVSACVLAGVVAASRTAVLGAPAALAIGVSVFGLPLAAFLFVTQRDLLASMVQRWVAAR
jgi:O-antigen/teichoic acid export membrane protein